MRICKCITIYIYINAFVNLVLKYLEYFYKEMFTNRGMAIFKGAKYLIK